MNWDNKRSENGHTIIDNNVLMVNWIARRYPNDPIEVGCCRRDFWLKSAERIQYCRPRITSRVPGLIDYTCTSLSGVGSVTSSKNSKIHGILFWRRISACAVHHGGRRAGGCIHWQQLGIDCRHLHGREGNLTQNLFRKTSPWRWCSHVSIKYMWGPCLPDVCFVLCNRICTSCWSLFWFIAGSKALGGCSGRFERTLFGFNLDMH